MRAFFKDVTGELMCQLMKKRRKIKFSVPVIQIGTEKDKQGALCGVFCDKVSVCVHDGA